MKMKTKTTMRNYILARDQEERDSHLCVEGASCELQATFMRYSKNSILMNDLIRHRGRSQMQILCKGIISPNLYFLSI